jgi:hypothetical protein
MISGKPLKCNLSSGIRPIRMSQMPNKIIPKLFVSLNLAILLLLEKTTSFPGEALRPSCREFITPQWL